MVDRFEIVIIHHEVLIDSCEWLKFYYDNAYVSGKISPERYFGFYDTFKASRNLHQKYGAYLGRQKINNKWEIFPIENIENVDSLRAASCLSPLHVFLKNNKFEIPEGYEYSMQDYVKNIRVVLNEKYLKKK